MKFSTKLIVAALAVGVAAVPASAQMRRNIRVVGSSTVYPFTKAVAERFARANPGIPAPIVESTGKHLADTVPPGRFLFAGSKIDQVDKTNKADAGERYRADLDGTLIGLTTFGSECIAWSLVYSPQADLQEPDWLADRERVPPYNTPVTIRIRPADAPEPRPAPDPEPAPAPKPGATPAPEVK